MMFRMTRSHELAFAQAHAVEDFRVAGDLGMRRHGAVERGEDVEDATHAPNAREHAILFGQDGGRGALVHIDTSVGGGIARGAVLQQRVLQDGRDSSVRPVHV